jgi:hypothetical protein
MNTANSEFRNIFSKFFNEQMEIDNRNSALLTSLSSDSPPKNFTYEMYSIGKNNEILSVLERYYSKLYQLFEKFDKNVLNPTDIFYENTSQTYDKCLDDCRLIILKATEASRNLDRIKSKYFEYVKEAEECKRMMETHSYNTDEMSILHDKHIRLFAQSQVLAEHLKYEIIKTNTVYEDCEIKYNEIVDKVKANEESRVSFILTQENKFARHLISIGSIYMDIGKDLENKSNMSYKEILSNFSKNNNNSNIGGEWKKSIGK